MPCRFTLVLLTDPAGFCIVDRLTHVLLHATCNISTCNVSTSENYMMRWIFRMGQDIFDLLYPVSCLVCGDRLTDKGHLCAYCINYAFQPANTEGMESSNGMVLPDWIAMQDVLWEFDKGGFLQDVLHHLKYSGLAELGMLLGRQLGFKLRKNIWMHISDDTVLLPVPLHPSRQKKRGYNQSALIAQGISEITGAVPAGSSSVVRIRNTRSQTGLNAHMRKKNLHGAFQVHDFELFRDKQVIIVDDVITTGATAFELAGIIREHAGKIGVASVARA